MQTYKLYTKMFNTDKASTSEKDVLKLYDATASAERGDVLRKAHAQQFIRVKTRRTLDSAKQIIVLLLKYNCILDDPRVGVHLVVVPRGTQSAEYMHGYAYKDQAEGDLFNAPSPLPEEAGHYRIGLTGAYAKECDILYKSHANDSQNKIAYSKGGANRPVRWSGASKKFPITKTSALDLGHAFVETEKFGEFGRRLPAVHKTSLLLQAGHHYLAPSFVMTYGSMKIDEEQVAALELVNNNVTRAEDISLVRKACFNYYERPSTLSDSIVMYKPGVLLGNQFAEELNLFEMRRHRDLRVLPPRVELARRYPYIPVGAKGQIIAIDFDYLFPYKLGESSTSILEYFAEHKFNIHPHIYHVGGIDNGQQSAYVSLGEIFMLYTKYGLRAFSEVTKFHVQSFLDYDWRRWCDRAAEVQGFSGAVTTEHMQKLLDALKGADDFSVDLPAFHGIMSADDFRSKFETWRPRYGDDDEAAERRTHTVIIEAHRQADAEPTAAEAAARAAEAAEAAAAAHPQDAIKKMIAETARARAAKAADEASMSLRVEGELQGQMDVGIRVNPALAQLHGVSGNARAEPVTPVVQPVVQLDLADLDDVLRAQRLRTPGGDALRILDEVEEACDDSPVMGTDAAGVPLPHYYMLAWRYGQHAIVQRRIRRENLTPYGELPRHVSMDPDRERRDLAAIRRAVVIDNDDGPDEDEEDDNV